MLLTLSLGAGAAAQNHRHTPQPQELVDSTSKDAVEVYSDTTSQDSATSVNITWDEDDADQQIEMAFAKLMNEWSAKDTMGVLLVLGVLFIIFVLAPVLIIAALFYFINKNRKQRLKLAQMAVQQGQPIPEQLLDTPGSADEEYQKGMRQCFVGAGLMIFLGFAAGEVGFGIGALVFCIGLGKVFAAKTSQKKQNEIMNDDSFNNHL